MEEKASKEEKNRGKNVKIRTVRGKEKREIKGGKKWGNNEVKSKTRIKKKKGKTEGNKDYTSQVSQVEYKMMSNLD